jgi:hypothetical protein
MKRLASPCSGQLPKVMVNFSDKALGTVSFKLALPFAGS